MPGPGVDILVVVGRATAPAALEARAGGIMRLADPLETTSLIAELRGHIPRLVGVVGDADTAGRVAHRIHDAGLPVVIFADEPVVVAPGVETWPVTDPGPPMEVSDSLIDLIGNTPLVRLNRTGRHLVAICWPSSSTSTPAGA